MEEKMPMPPSAGQKSRPYKRESDQLNLPYQPQTPQLTRTDPSLPTAGGTEPRKILPDQSHVEIVKVHWTKRFCTYLYDSHNKTYCDRTCESWLKILAYAVVYLVFLMTYTMIFLYIALVIIKNQDSPGPGQVELLTYSPGSIGLTATPLSEFSYPLIWYRSGDADDYKRYVTALDKLVSKKRVKRDVSSDLGPCGYPPYGYGDEPCIVVRMNKQWHWLAKPLRRGSPEAKLAPEEVQKWIKNDDNKYWLHCNGIHSYDREHIGKIKYYPDPPGFDSGQVPLNNTSVSPLIGVQVSNFTVGISLAIECKLWYENGVSSVAFLLYVSPKSKGTRNDAARFR